MCHNALIWLPVCALGVASSGVPDDLPLITLHGRVLIALDQQPKAKQEDLADLLGMHRRSVNRAIADLREHGYIDTERGQYGLNVVINRKRKLGDGQTLDKWLSRFASK